MDKGRNPRDPDYNDLRDGYAYAEEYAQDLADHWESGRDIDSGEHVGKAAYAALAKMQEVLYKHLDEDGETLDAHDLGALYTKAVKEELLQQANDLLVKQGDEGDFSALEKLGIFFCP